MNEVLCLIDNDIKSLKKSVYDIKLGLLKQGADVSESVKRIEEINSFLITVTDIKHIPKAVGLHGDIQDIYKDMLLYVTSIITSNGLDYWLDFGTLLGARRHGGFIPWDDDVDISMPISHYQKFEKNINEYLKNSDYVAAIVPSQIIKIFHKSFAPVGDKEVLGAIHWSSDKFVLALDIFPYYFTSNTESAKKTIDKYMIKTEKLIGSSLDMKDFRSAHELMLSMVVGKLRTENTDYMVLGPETWVYQPRVVPTKYVYLLKTIIFEGNKFKAPNETDLYLIDIYGDFMSMPRIDHIHIDKSQITKEDMKKLKG